MFMEIGPTFFKLLGAWICKQPQVNLVCQSPIIEGFQAENSWHIAAQQGRFSARNLVVAQSPWQALTWLERKHIPIPVLKLGLKSKPVSIVTLCERLLAPCILPDVTLVPAEGVELYHNRKQSICLQATIDYELSLDAPSVGKAIRRLKRAQRKVHKLLDGAATAGEKIALQTVAWAHAPAVSEQKFIAALEAWKQDGKERLFFVGDAYGG